VTTLALRSFSGGEIAPALYARVDTAKYATGLRTCRNSMIMRHGGAQNRPGTVFVGEVKDSTKSVRLIPFVFNADQTYMLEFGDLYMRVIRDGAQQYDLTLTITGISNANPGVVTYTGTDPVNGEEVYISGVTGAIGTYLNGRNFKIANVNAGSNTFELQTMAGANFNTTSLGSYTSGGTAKRVYTITTPYLEADLPTLQFIQSADVVTIVHPSYAPRELVRTGHTSWTLSALTFAPTTARPANVLVVGGGAGTGTYRYVVTAIDADTLEESLAGLTGATQTITGATQANPVRITTSGAHGYVDSLRVRITGVVGMTEINNRTFLIDVISATTFDLIGEDGAAHTAYSSGGTAQPSTGWVENAAAPTPADPHVISWNAVAGASEYNIYKESNGVYGLIGVASTPSFNDIGIDPDTTETPPVERNPFANSGDYPSAVTYIQQRRGFANTNNDPEKIWLSRIGQYPNFTTNSPLQDDDAVTFTMAGRQVNAVRHLLDLGKLVVFTTSGEWLVEGDASGIITPSGLNPKQQSYNGSSTLPPLVIGGNALYVQARGSIVRDLAFTFQSDRYEGSDLTVFSAHLFDKYSLVDWTYQQIPHSVIWAVRDDGVLLGLTYVREQQLWGWHRHDTDGDFENACSIPEGTEDAVYLVVNRTIGGVTKRFIERMQTRMVDDIKDSIFMDSALSYDGRHTGSTTMTLTEYLAGGWLYTSKLTLTASASTFASTDVGNEIQLTGADGEVIRFEITEYVSATVVRGKPHKTVPVAMRSVAVSTWAMAVDELSGLWHIEGEAVSVLADGFVVGSPNNAAYTTLTVTNGAITLDKPHAVIHVGLPYISDLETLDIDTAQGETLVDKKKHISRVTAYAEDSRGGFVGPRPPTDDDTDPLEDLYEFKVRNTENYDDPVALTTGTFEINIEPQWNSNGRVFVRQVDPLPLAILALAPAGLMPFK
jgi:hypothetical protein